MKTIRRTRREFEQLEAELATTITLCRAAAALGDHEDAKRAAQEHSQVAVQLQNEINRSLVEW